MWSFAILIQGGAFDAVRRSLPNDPASLFILLLCAVAIIAVFVGGRGRKGSDPGGDA